MSEEQVKQPIGYWLNRTDQALTRRMDELLERDGLSRVGWQVLNVLHAKGGLVEGDLYRMLEANATSDVLVDTVNTLLAHGWILRTEYESAMTAPQLHLSSAGQAVHGRIQRRVGEFRQQSMHGISKEEYQAAIDVLQRIVHNVDAIATSTLTAESSIHELIAR